MAKSCAGFDAGARFPVAAALWAGREQTRIEKSVSRGPQGRGYRGAGRGALLRDPAATVLEFLPAPAGTRLVPAHFGGVATHRRQIELQLGTVAIGRNGVARGGHPLAVSPGNRPGRGRCTRRLLLEKELRQS